MERGGFGRGGIWEGKGLLRKPRSSYLSRRGREREEYRGKGKKGGEKKKGVRESWFSKGEEGRGRGLRISRGWIRDDGRKRTANCKIFATLLIKKKREEKNHNPAISLTNPA